MNFKKLSLCLTTLGLLLSYQNANAATATGNATAQIYTKINVSETTQMNFGKIAISTTASTVKLAATGNTIDCPGTYECTGSPSSAVFNITGTTGQGVTIAYTNGTITSGANTMPIKVTSITTPNTTSITSLIAGNNTLNVGGEIDVATNQASGTYTGTYTVAVNY